MPRLTDLRERLQRGVSNRYRIERELGRGGAGSVYLAHDLRDEQPVALKVLDPELAHSVGPDRFLREIQVAARLEHPGVVAARDSGDTEGLLWFAMPYVEGESVRDRLVREGQLPLTDALRIAADAARTLEYAHQRGVIHRDIKPENLLLDRQGGVFVADFGIARALDGDGTQLTETGMSVGTPAYMSPEQAGGERRLDARSDIYSLGAVLYEMLAGEPPFTASTPQAILAKQMQAPVPDVRVVRPTVPVQLQEVLETALAKVPADRFASAGEFAEAIERSSARAILARRRRVRQVGMLAAAAVAVPALILIAKSVIGPAEARGRTTDVASGPPRIAVLYFDAQPPDSTLRLFADGLTEELIHELSGVNAFRVISRNGVRPYRDRQVSFDSMVASLHPTTVVDGSVRRSGDRLQVSVQLIDARSDTYVDSLSVEHRITNFVTVEREVAQQVAAALRRQMGREVWLRGTIAGTTNERARELVLKAQSARDQAAVLAEQPHTEDVRTGIEVLERAESLLALAQSADPRWLRPIIDRGWVIHDLAHMSSNAGHSGLEPAAAQKSIQLAEEALRRSPGNAGASELRGTLLFELVTENQGAPNDSTRLRQAEGDLRSALDRDSTLATAWATLSYLLLFRGRTAEAEMAGRRALGEDPYLADARDTFRMLFFTDILLGDFAQAAEWCRRGRLSFPKDWHFVECELTLMRHNARATPEPDSAWALVKELDRLDPADKARAEGRAYHPIYRRVVAATISARAGRRGIARAELARARRATVGDSTLRLDLASDEAYLRLVLGERERATALLRQYIQARPMARDYLARDPLLRGLRLWD